MYIIDNMFGCKRRYKQLTVRGKDSADEKNYQTKLWILFWHCKKHRILQYIIL